MTSSSKLVTGAAPQGATDATSAAHAVRDMFTSIAPRYDLLNHVLSLNIDRVWWRRAARTFREVLSRPDARVLDLCCGTGDMTFALRRQAGKSSPQSSPNTLPQLLGADFSHAMLQRALRKSSGNSADNSSTITFSSSAKPVPRWIEADALNLPFPSQHFDLVTSAFGFRNLADYDAGLREIVRILRPGGECGILDFGEPKGMMGQLYRIYFKHVLPRVGTMISGVRGPYAYLPASVERFPEPEEMLTRMRQAGFAEATWTPYTFGIAGLYRGRK
jgi:demethylmenaquinone methyltransferase/2-methoxy-6-polyprenyl-1,4-benzoquinol methylase